MLEKDFESSEVVSFSVWFLQKWNRTENLWNWNKMETESSYSFKLTAFPTLQTILSKLLFNRRVTRAVKDAGHGSLSLSLPYLNITEIYWVKLTAGKRAFVLDHWRLREIHDFLLKNSIKIPERMQKQFLRVKLFLGFQTEVLDGSTSNVTCLLG